MYKIQFTAGTDLRRQVRKALKKTDGITYTEVKYPLDSLFTVTTDNADTARTLTESLINHPNAPR